MAALGELGGAARTAAEGAGDAMRAAGKLENVAEAGENVLRFTRGGTTMEIRVARGASSEAGAMNAFKDFMKANPDQATADLAGLNSAVKATEDAHPNPKTSEIRDVNGKAASTADAGNWVQRTKTFFGNNWKPILAGMSVTALMAAAGVFLGCTDGKTVNITNLSIVPNTSNTQVQVTFNPPADCFRPRINDTFTFSGTQTTPRLETFGDCVITKIISKTSVVVTLTSQITDIVTGTGGWGQAKCTSCFENQLAGTFGSVIATIVTAAVQTAASALPAAVQGVCSAMPSLCNAFGGAGEFFDKLKIVGIVCLLLCILGLGVWAVSQFS